MDSSINQAMRRMNIPGGARGTIVVAMILLAGVVFLGYGPSQEMLILRGIASEDAPRGQLDDESATAYARKLGYSPEILDVAADIPAGKSQIQMAVERIRKNKRVTAIYGFSGGGYNAQSLWSQLSAAERQRIRKIVVVGSPGVTVANFPGVKDVVVQPDPPQGHMAGPKVLLQTVSQ